MREFGPGGLVKQARDGLLPVCSLCECYGGAQNAESVARDVPRGAWRHCADP